LVSALLLILDVAIGLGPALFLTVGALGLVRHLVVRPAGMEPHPPPGYRGPRAG
jgi:hypothetical protein